MKRARDDESSGTALPMTGGVEGGELGEGGGASAVGERSEPVEAVVAVAESPYHGEGLALGVREVPQLTRKPARFFCRNCSRDVTLEPRMKCAVCPPGFVLCLTCFR